MIKNNACFNSIGKIFLLATGLVFGAAVYAQDAAIESPTDGEVVYTNLVALLGYDSTAVDNTAQWAVRRETCAASTNTVAGNVDGYSDAFDWTDGVFSALFDATGLPGGEYCFVLNTRSGPAAGHRLTRVFYLVDQYVKAGGTLYMGEAGRGNSPTHAIEGVVGKVDGGAVYGSITINYRMLGKYRTFDATALTFRDAQGIGVYESMAVGEITTTEGGKIFVLDRDAALDFPRGAIVVRPGGSPSVNPYEIDATPGSGGPESWVPMDRGNNHTGVR